MYAIDGSWGPTLDDYLNTVKTSPPPLPALQQVKDSIAALLGNPSPQQLMNLEPISCTTFEDLLSLAYRPKYLYLLNVPLIPSCYGLLMQHAKDIGVSIKYPIYYTISLSVGGIYSFSDARTDTCVCAYLR